MENAYMITYPYPEPTQVYLGEQPQAYQSKAR